MIGLIISVTILALVNLLILVVMRGAKETDLFVEEITKKRLK
jgi:hypothetical protein